MNFLEKAFVKNQYLGWHVMGGVVITMVCLKVGLVKEYAFLATLGIAILWEVGELLFANIKKNYINYNNYYADAFGDIMGASLASFTIVVLI